MTGWGSGPWGETPWGYGGVVVPDTPPDITPLDPLSGAANVPQQKPISVRYSDERGVVFDSITLAVGGVYYVIGGVAANGAQLSYTGSEAAGYDIVVTLPAPYPLGTTQEVFTTCMDTSGYLSTLTYYFSVGVGLRLLSVHNPKEKVLVVYFNNPLERNSDYFFTGNWRVSRLDGEEDDFRVLSVTGKPTNPQTARLIYSGGAATMYELQVFSIIDKDGNSIERGWDTAQFDLLFDQEEEPTVRLFDSSYGPIGVSQNLRSRRTIDDHCVDRALSLGFNEQLRIRRASQDDTIGRDGRPGKNRF